MKTFEKYRQILSKHQNIKMLSVMQVDNICRAMYDLEKENSQPLPSISDEEIEKMAEEKYPLMDDVEMDFVTEIIKQIAFSEGGKAVRDRLTTQKDNNGWVSIDKLKEFYFESMEDYHLWDEEGKPYPAQRQLDAIKQFIDRNSPTSNK